MTPRNLMVATVLAGVAFASPALAAEFSNICTTPDTSAFKVCASADVTVSGNQLIVKVWNLNETPQDGGSLADYASENGGWHTIAAIGVRNLSYGGGPFSVVAQYWDGSAFTNLAGWAGTADANSIQVYDTGASTSPGHENGITGCKDPGPAQRDHVQTCGPTQFVQFTISGFTSLALTDETQFGYHGLQIANSNCDPTDLNRAGYFEDDDCTEDSAKGWSEPPGEVVPEPFTMILLGSGLAGVAVARRRRRDGDVEDC